MKWIVYKNRFGLCYAASVIEETLTDMRIDRKYTRTINKAGCDWVSFGSDKDAATHAASEMNRERGEIKDRCNADLKRLNDAFFKDRDREV